MNDLVYINKKMQVVPPETGSVVVMDVNNGEVLSLVSLPNFNINKRANITN